MLLDRLTAGGGAERFAVGLAKELSEQGCRVVVCATREAFGPLPEELAAAGVRLVVLGRRSKVDVLRFRRLVGLLRGGRCDVLHSHMFGSNLWGVFFGRLCRVPAVVAHEHSWSYEGQPIRRLADGYFVGRLAGAFVAVSSFDRERMIAIERVPERKAVFVPTAYAPHTGGTGDVRAELGIDPAAPVVGTLAVLRPQKALHVLLEAFALLLRSLPDAHLIVGGGGECAAALERQASELRIDHRVHFLGMRRDVEAVVGALDVAAMSSDFEGMPLFAFECMAHRTPLVATDVGGIRDVLEPGRNVVLVPPRNPIALAAEIAALLEDPGRRRALASAAHERLADFTMERIATRFVALYQRLLAEGSS